MREKRRTIRDEDYEFVSLSKKGDVNAFEVLVKKHQKRMFNIAYRMVGNYEEASEIVQDAFVSAYRGIKNFKGKAKFSTWLYTIVINLSRNRLRQLKVQLHRERHTIENPVLTNKGTYGEPASSEPSALERLEKRDIQQQVQGCINSLGDEFREVLVLRDIQGFSYDEISDVLKLPEGTVKSRLFRARGVLKDCLKKVIGDL
ncbi:MAG: sigma-70 family RNA polymerase sigma factor [Syntrophobacterales bacterium]|nr:MAG: sigma-70 family RNA polymerase sigma factor [Syntrophobacterales bacterium]